jgi:O-phospho-L-seryl-tRNASec:L-selenocysteinyl-tRNA synthase
MDATSASLAGGLVDAAYIAQGMVEIRKRDAAVRSLLAHRNLPDDGWDDDTVEHFLRQLALMDSNNFTAAVGAGEREARIFSGIVRRRHWGLGHGIGRSGDVAAVQPKAAGQTSRPASCPLACSTPPPTPLPPAQAAAWCTS